ncbi:TniQ family protein [Shimia aestuarii]|uniref:TniQ family protein n=1 Tax=Shimia aestuarii TaxID=254406 RepID=UPI001FB4A86B|nr:TniQ family protein [Shimia aestuarii]
MAKLFPKVSFVHDETPLSWAARQAAFHKGGRLVPFLNDLRIPAIDLARGLPAAVHRLCEIAGQDPAPVVWNTISSIGARRFSLRQHEFSAEFTTGVETRICPYCLAEDQYDQRRPDVATRHRLAWRLAPVRTCRRHGTLLRDARKSAWDDQLHELQAMQDIIAAELAVPEPCEPRAPSPLQTYVENRLEGHSGPIWLDGQGIDQASRAVEMVGGLIAFGPKQQAAELSQRMWDDAGRAGWGLAAGGEAKVVAFLEDTLKASTRSEGFASPRSAFGMLYAWLNSGHLSKDPGPIRALLRHVIIENTPLVPGRNVLGQPVARPKYSTLSSISKSENVHPSTLHNLLKAAGMSPGEGGATGAGRLVVDYAKVVELLGDAKFAVPTTQVPYVLTCSRPVVSALIELGLLSRIHDHQNLQSKVGKAVDGRSINEVLDVLRDRFDEVEELPAGMEPLARCAEKSRAKLKVILELLFKGHLSNVVRLDGQVGFAAIHLDPEEIKSVLETPPVGVSEDAYFLIH